MNEMRKKKKKHGLENMHHAFSLMNLFYIKKKNLLLGKVEFCVLTVKTHLKKKKWRKNLKKFMK